MSAMVLPDGTVMDVFGSGGGEAMAERLRTLTGANVPLLGSVPLDPRLREGGDAGVPLALGAPDSPAGQAIHAIADKLVVRRESLAGKSLGLGVTRKG